VRVVSNTSPICYLVLIGHIDVLPALFRTVTIPQAVQEELLHPAAAPVLQRWISNPPSWLQVQPVPETTDADLLLLDPGERDAILLAEALRADLVLLDDRRARDLATKRCLSMTGLIGVLARAADRGLLSSTEAIDRLQRTSFRADPALYRLLLARGER
jgi:predicted nucleic acid-binding protein